MGEQSKYCRELFDIKTENMRRDALIIFPIEWHHKTIILMGKQSKYCRDLFDIKTENMHRDALIVFLLNDITRRSFGWVNNRNTVTIFSI